MKQCIEYKSQGQSHTDTILANKGICWSVENLDGTTSLVQKKHVVRQWEEPETDEPKPLDPLSFAALALGCTTPTPPAKKKEKEPEADRTNVVTLKQLCFDLKVEPRIARRRLRKALGQVGTGSRWEWEKGSEALDKVKAAICPPAAEAE